MTKVVMLKVLVIEDETSVQKDISGLLKLMGNIEVLGVIDTVAEALQVLPGAHADAVLLDINLKDGTAFDLISQLPKRDFNIIFITAFEQYAINAIKIGALDYLLKPVDFEELKQALHKVKAPQQEQLAIALQASKNKADKIVLKNTEGIHLVLFNELMYCKSDGAYTRFYTLDGKSVMVSKPMKEYEQILPASDFIKSHQSYIANKTFIKKINRDGFLELQNGTLIPVSDRKKDQVIKELTQ